MKKLSEEGRISQSAREDQGEERLRERGERGGRGGRRRRRRRRKRRQGWGGSGGNKKATSRWNGRARCSRIGAPLCMMCAQSPCWISPLLFHVSRHLQSYTRAAATVVATRAVLDRARNRASSAPPWRLVAIRGSRRGETEKYEDLRGWMQFRIAGSLRSLL